MTQSLADAATARVVSLMKRFLRIWTPEALPVLTATTSRWTNSLSVILVRVVWVPKPAAITVFDKSPAEAEACPTI